MEIWKDIEGYEGLYKISNYGRLLTCGRKIIAKNKTKKVYDKRMMKFSIKNGYYYANITKLDGKQKYKYIHRLVAKAFIPNPNNLPQVNHIDGNKFNNRADNLEWCTVSHNNKEAYRIGLRETRKVMCVETKQKYFSIKEAEEKTGFCHIYDAINGKRKTAGKTNGVSLHWVIYNE